MGDLNTIDLFAGAGGITEGFRQAGFNCLYSNDFNENAVETFRLNHRDTWATHGPIENQDPESVRHKLGLQKGELDCILGGPPCQGFSIYAPDRILDDPRNSMFRHYLRFVDEFAPRTLLIENVPGMLSLGGGRVVETILRELTDRGYKTSCRIMLAAHFGVPQNRFRLIFLASLSPGLVHPEPTHFHEALANFTGGSTLTTRLRPLDSLMLEPAVTLRDAISDLPMIEAGGGAEEMPYGKRREISKYAAELRMGTEKLFNHTSNKLSPINLERLRHIPAGGAWTNIPFELLPEGMKKARRSDHTKRYGRLAWDSLACTMLTKCDPHWGAVFHPDQARAFSVREAARIQSFPDYYRFKGNRGSQFEQVGNAVPVLLARAIAETMKSHLEVRGKSSCAA
ncbi:DNA cytosine methyltransferase [Phragmitibacter flavus]|uniref:Cytosine-specific methyltransferase n=1 Tax=Phragmitibacter flavus TaxID=2576071 RepID=A0A5R8KI66_9BACT|nr:DNA cytosine methyltransferase [Phragmitibacter flavus]TLD71972.1 DNA cytosine methyltransferase [Phragmitibacter flavus]